MENEYDGLRTYIEAVRGIGQCKDIEGADWDLEIGTLTEAATELIAEPPMMLFDNIKGYPKGFRVLSLPLASKKRAALVYGLSPDDSFRWANAVHAIAPRCAAQATARV